MNLAKRLKHECRFQLSRSSVRILLLLATLLSSSAVLLGHHEINAQRASIERLAALDLLERSTAWQKHADWGDVAYYGFH
jgi:hypothetical protein